MVKTVADENFSDFPLGAFPYDKEHSAMGEYHYYPEEGYKGNWLDPITNWNYKGPTWLVTSPFMSNVHVMEQMRVQYDAGMVPVSEFLQTETAYAQAESELLDSQIAYRTALRAWLDKSDAGK